MYVEFSTHATFQESGVNEAIVAFKVRHGKLHGTNPKLVSHDCYLFSTWRGAYDIPNET